MGYFIFSAALTAHWLSCGPFSVQGVSELRSIWGAYYTVVLARIPAVYNRPTLYKHRLFNYRLALP